MQSPSKLHGVALPAGHDLLGEHPVPPGGDPGWFVPVEHAGLPFVPFHAGLLRFLLPPTRAALAHLPAIKHQHGQGRRRASGCAFGRHTGQGGLGAGFRFGAEFLAQGVQAGGGDAHAPFVRHGGGFGIRRGGGDSEGQLVFQGQAQLLMRAQAPMLADGAAPVPVARILTVQHTQFNHTDAGAQMHRSGAPMHRLAPAVGGKSRRAGRRFPAGVVGV